MKWNFECWRERRETLHDGIAVKQNDFGAIVFAVGCAALSCGVHFFTVRDNPRIEPRKRKIISIGPLEMAKLPC
jgi:hypothetical protein